MKKFLSAFVAVLFIVNLSASAYASVLGSSKVTGYSVGIGKGTTFTSGVFYSDQSGVGKQTENYITYTPNAAVTPIITNGEYLFGAKTISNEVERLSNKGVNLVGGINADFFSLQTGVPMSNLVVDGEIITKVTFNGGCSGNTQGVASLVRGMSIHEAIERLEGIRCGFRPTSCPDQVATALKEIAQE